MPPLVTSPVAKVAVVLSLVAVFSSFALGARSITLLAAPLALVIVVAIIHFGDLRAPFRALLTPYAPFIVLLALSIPFQQHFSPRALVAIVMAYAFARLFRLLLPLSWIAWGIAFTALIVGLLRMLRNVDALGNVEIFAEAAAIVGKNPTGWTLAFGAAAAIALVILSWGSRRSLIASSTLVFSIIALLVLADSVAPLVAAASMLFVVGALLLISAYRKNSSHLGLRPLAGTLLGSSGGLAGLLLVANFTPGLSGGLWDYLQRDFSNLTGRDVIWQCYIQAVSSQAADPWQATLECTPFTPAHLHNIFFETHLISGWLAALALLGGVLTSIVLAVRHATRASNLRDLTTHLFALAVGIVVLLVGLVESFLYYFLIFGAVIVFLAPPSTAARTDTSQGAK